MLQLRLRRGELHGQLAQYLGMGVQRVTRRAPPVIGNRGPEPCHESPPFAALRPNELQNRLPTLPRRYTKPRFPVVWRSRAADVGPALPRVLLPVDGGGRVSFRPGRVVAR